MDREAPLWLVVNAASGSNDAAALEALNRCCGEAGFHVSRTIHFPDEPLPSAAELESAGVPTLAVFAGDGTTSATVTSLYGWRGSVLILPGGTMNLLYHRLHGEAEMEQVIRQAAGGRARRVRPAILRSRQGDALAELLTGPGTAWYEVREALREGDVLAVADQAAQAIGATVGSPMIVCMEPRIGREEGYPLLMLSPKDDGFEVSGYYSEGIGDYLSHGLALLRRDFRSGPHDELGMAERLILGSLGGEELGIALDGEMKQGNPVETFEVARCEVDLLATDYHG